MRNVDGALFFLASALMGDWESKFLPALSSYDKDQDGKMNIAEFTTFIMAAGCEQNEVEESFDGIFNYVANECPSEAVKNGMISLTGILAFVKMLAIHDPEFVVDILSAIGLNKKEESSVLDDAAQHRASVEIEGSDTIADEWSDMWSHSS